MALAALGLTFAGCGASTAGSESVQTVTLVRTTTVTHTVTTTSTTSACDAGELAGTFDVVPGSSGAGQIEYALKLTNTSQTPCSLNGIAQVQLLDSSGSQLPTRAGSGPGGHVTLSPGASAVASARFSPDVSGQGDSQGGPCQPTAHTLRFSPAGGGSVDAPIKPPTSVCEQGRLSFQPFAAG